jgi:hypothetical protein
MSELKIASNSKIHEIDKFNRKQKLLGDAL